MTKNVRGLCKSHWDLRRTIATLNPDILVIAEIELRRNSKPRAWMETLLKNYKYWLAFDWTGGTTIGV
eukprot:139472-Pelagomonas_calceolata.AAC.2